MFICIYTLIYCMNSVSYTSKYPEGGQHVHVKHRFYMNKVF